ncbi:MAG TPA: 4Fe-4S dicluster domain-containing protein [Smithellaceae bacterium]|jgi:heterodisulfide reductase subunit C|nr:4Fe-4S dicluster domain-containing protein [Smithellaceae bacterium]
MENFLEEVNKKINGVPIQRCYHCRKCTAGCPMSSHMEYNINKVIKMIQNGKRDEVLNSSTIWLCLSCETCITRCPNEVDIARMMDVLRQMAIESGVGAREKNILTFHEAFLSGMKSGGRINEPMMMVKYKLKSGDYLADAMLGLDMFKKGKLALLSPRTKDMKSVRNIFEKTKTR